jgi:DMSO/TMAO reductase YedYZ heme-binding membrane subunit
MNKETYVKKFMIITAVIIAVVMAILHVIFFKQVEETVFLEIAKRVFMSIGILGVWELFAAFCFGPLAYHFGPERRKK